jgi:signal transduction histidine kinase
MGRTPPSGASFQDMTIKTKLLLMMLSLLLLSMSLLFVLAFYGQRTLISEVRNYTDELSTAIEIAQEQPASEGDAQGVVAAYADKLRQLGVKDVSIADEDEVQASTNPANVGKKLVKKSRKGPREIVIKGVLGEESGPPGSQRTSTLTIPIVVNDRRVGYVVVTRILDDFSDLARASLLYQLAATLGVFALGILVSLYLSSSFVRPLHALTAASRQVAAGDLSVQVPAGSGGEIGALSQTFNEMVERLRENRRLEERLHFAERATALGRLASGVAHEIRNPLNFINLSIDHVRQRLHPEDPGRREDFERILENVKSEINRLNRLVGDFLSFGKPMRLYRRSCSVDRLLRDVAALVDHKARDQGIALAVEADQGLPEIVADPELLKTCFLNLLINAVDAMPDGGLLTLAVRKDADDALRITVTDTGQGMAAEDARTAFEPYFSTKETGLGLGLALTHKIVTDHGGTIVLDSEQGRGTTVTIRLPLVADAPAEDEATAIASQETA